MLPDRFGALLVVGFTVQVALQAVLNVAVVTNTIPNTGISLPFFSSGGTSLMMLLGRDGHRAFGVPGAKADERLHFLPRQGRSGAEMRKKADK